ncbi:MAG: hypothetical protein HY721_31815 [Planctomycetes bacterium]|nr:hypothetical protein [Planctomycetota bacterium]
MMTLPPFVLLHGTDRPPQEPIPLEAGMVSVLLEDGELRRVCLGGREMLRRIHCAVRDRNWGTVPGVISGLAIHARPDSFSISYLCEHRQGDVDFAWQGSIEGRADGTVRFVVDGEARSTFLRNRIGLCVLHPPQLAGSACVCEHAGGPVERGTWPKWISPSAPFKDIRALSHEVFPGLWAYVRFEGEVFEMEDHRNWTDASFKTFCTPLSIPYPAEVRKGTRITQSVTLRLEGELPDLPQEGRKPKPSVAVDRARPRPLPRIGLGVASHGKPLARREVARLKALRLSHLRADLRLARPGWEAALRQAASEAAALGARLEAALFLSDAGERELEALAAALREVRAPVLHWLVFHEREKVTSEPWVRLARDVLRRGDPSARVGSGTDVEFVDLNRTQPPREILDLACYSANPQVHATDDESLLENMSAQGTTVESARELLGGLPVAVTPITLKRRFNPDATGPVPDPPPGELPPQVDPRQMSLFGAVWTVGSIKHLGEAGAASLTYYETTGWRGVLERHEGSPVPDRFPSIPGAVFPLYHVLADVGEMAGGELLPSSSTDPLKVECLALRHGGRLRLIVANLLPEDQAVQVAGLEVPARVRPLDETTALEAMRSPEKFRSRRRPEVLPDCGRLQLMLLPFAVATIDCEEA